MKKRITQYFPYFLKSIITLCLLFSMLAKPISSIIFQIADIKYELCENFEEVDSEEKEDTFEYEDENKKLCYFNNLNSKFNTRKNLSYFLYQKNLIGVRPDTPFPPPEKC